MSTRISGYLILPVFLLAFSAAFAQDWEMAPAPADRTKFDYSREVGKPKLNELGLIDPTPDVISLEYLPKDEYGFVDWARAVREGAIAPKDTLSGRTDADKEVFDEDVLFRVNKDFMPDVIFPHRPHNVWLKCGTCHPRIFKMKAGANRVSMYGIWDGEFCGRCHGRVAFPTSNCLKCHTVKKETKK
ncbi:MAG TPA: c(7)-type cytochrome triheme domain-containing protein [Thermodesulfobacteriota bacterium]|nr:c(7)-type cytochrome triheme domain-containing protein [Thermodesulfobacteriota bacterium]